MGITTAGVECKLGDTTVMLKPLTVRQVEQIDNWIRSQFLRSVRDAADGDEEMLAIGMREMLSLSYFSTRGIRFLSTLQGMAMVLSESAGIDREEAAKLMESADAIQEFNTAYKLLNSQERSDPTRATVAANHSA